MKKFALFLVLTGLSLSSKSQSYKNVQCGAFFTMSVSPTCMCTPLVTDGNAQWCSNPPILYITPADTVPYADTVVNCWNLPCGSGNYRSVWTITNNTYGFTKYIIPISNQTVDTFSYPMFQAYGDYTNGKDECFTVTHYIYDCNGYASYDIVNSFSRSFCLYANPVVNYVV